MQLYIIYIVAILVRSMRRLALLALMARALCFGSPWQWWELGSPIQHAL